MPKFTEIPLEFRESYKNKFNLKDNEEIKRLADEDPVIFSFYFLGKKVRLHQAFIMHKILISPNKRVAACWARQLGKSIGFGCFLIWQCWFNKFPVTISKITIWYIVSKEDESAVELLEKMRLILYDGNRHMMQFVEEEDYFTGSLKEPNNTHQITFKNNCFIKSIPPTMKAVGKSASGLLIDEAHRLRCVDMDPDTFFDYATAIVAETGGWIILSSSPEGIIGFFHRAIDPDKQYPENEYQSFWFDHTIWDDGTKECKTYQKFVQDQKIRMIAAGRLKYWQQEYGALFTVTETAFFDHEDIEDNLEDVPNLYEYKETPCSLGIDYGMKNARTVLTIRAKIRDTIRQIFQWRSPADFDINKLKDPEFEHSIPRLKKRYNLFMVVADDCPAGDTTNRYLEEDPNLEFKKYNFRSDQMSKTDGINRNCLAYSYRAAIKIGKLKIPNWNKVQQFEMKTVQEVVQKVLISIKSPEGQLCDTFDSDMMASLPFLDMQTISDFYVDPMNEGDTVKVDSIDPRKDPTGFKTLTPKQCKKLMEDASTGMFLEDE